MNNETDISLKFRNSVTGEKKLKEYAETLSKIQAVANGMNEGMLKQAESSAKNLGKNTKNLDVAVKTAFNYTKVRAFSRALSTTVKEMSRLVKKSSDYLENINLYQVAFDGAYQEADKFINKITEMYGIDQSWATKTVGIFRQLANAMNLATEDGTKLSTLMTQMSLDISSLYNIDIDRASSVLQSALAGQTKPIRGATGADITQATLQTTLDNLGIEKSVANLSYAEKRLLIIISLTQQLNQSIGDMGRTIESPSNQIRVMQSQWETLGRTLGNVFLPVVAKILPYINAILMVMNEILAVVAALVGYNTEDYDYFAGTADSVIELEEGLEGANESAKKLKQGLRGFDKLNNISSNQNSGSSVSGSGISADILGAFEDAYSNYNNTLTDVQMKATKIRDNIMEWLGFTKIVDEETGKVSFKFDHITGGTVLGALVVGGAIYKGVKSIFKMFKSISVLKAAGGTVLKLLTGTKNGESIASAAASATDAITSTSAVGDVAKNKSSSFKIPNAKDIATGMADIAIIVGGTVAILAAVGLVMQIPNAKKLMTEGISVVKEAFNGILQIAIPLAAMSAGAALLGGVGFTTVLSGLGGLALIIDGLPIVLLAIGGLMSISGFKNALSTGIKAVQDSFNGIASICGPLLILGGAMAATGILMAGSGATGYLAILAGLGAFAEILGGIVVVVAALGFVAEIDGASKKIEEGGKILALLAKAIGEAIGALIEGVLASSLYILDDFGTHLSTFMTNAQPFFEGVKNVGSESFAAIKNLADCILSLTASNVIQGLTSWFAGEVDLAEFGEQLEEFGPSFKKYADSVQGLDAKVVENSTKAAESLVALAKQLPNQGGLLAAIVGDNKLKDFAKQLPEFGENLKSYANNVKGLDVNVVENSANAADSVIAFSKKIPNEGGMVSWFTGDNKLGTFAKQLPEFGKNFKSYYTNINGIDSSIITDSATAADAIVAMVKKLPNQGGMVSWFTGDNKLSDFGKEMKKFGENFKGYYDYLNQIDLKKITDFNNQIDKTISNLKTIKSNGLNDTLKNFGKELKGYAENAKAFFSNAFNGNDAYNIGKTFGSKIGSGISAGIKTASLPTLNLKSNTSPYNSIGTYKFSAYANGGLPEIGQLFVANEKGPELVGQIGGQSFVANQNQMLEFLDKNVKTSSSSINPTIIVQVGSKEIARTVISDLQDMARNNGKSITIGG